MTLHLVWNSIEIAITHSLNMFGDAHHIEVKSITPTRAPLPITETGYKSHFYIAPDGAMLDAEVVEMVTKWIEKEAKTKRWKNLDAQSRQLLLF